MPDPVLVLTTHDLDAYVYDALGPAPPEFLLKATPGPTVVGGVRTVAAGDALLAPSSLTRRLIEHVAGRRRSPRACPKELRGLTGA